MIIANPIYDLVFKTLMQEERLAKFFLEALIDEFVQEISVLPQEILYKKSGSSKFRLVSTEVEGKGVVTKDTLTLLRLDFIAKIKLGDGTYRKVLIELQKVRKMYDVQRFRNYLGEQYKKTDIVINGGKEVSLPIVTVYLLGFDLKNLKPAATKVERRYLDLQTKEEVVDKDDFIEKLTHDCYVVQLPKIKKSFGSKLDRILNLFEQNRFVDDSNVVKDFDTNDVGYEPEILEMADLLHFVCTDPLSKKNLEDEIEVLRSFKVYEGNIRDEDLKVINEQKEMLQEKDIVIQEKETVIKEKENVIQEKETVIKEKENVIQEKESVIQEKESMIQQKESEIEEKNRKLAEAARELEEYKKLLEESLKARKE